MRGTALKGDPRRANGAAEEVPQSWATEWERSPAGAAAVASSFPLEQQDLSGHSLDLGRLRRRGWLRLRDLPWRNPIRGPGRPRLARFSFQHSVASQAFYRAHYVALMLSVGALKVPQEAGGK